MINSQNCVEVGRTAGVMLIVIFSALSLAAGNSAWFVLSRIGGLVIMVVIMWHIMFHGVER